MEAIYKVKSKDILLKTFSDKITLWCFGDIHRFTKSCDEDRWKWFLEKAKKTHTENTYYLGLGDYTDFASASEVKAIQSTLHNQTVVDLGELVQKRNRLFSMEMAFMKPNVLGLIEGNHNWTFSDGKTATEDLADRLMTESLGYLCHYTLRVKWANRGPNQVLIYIVACHAKAGGKTAGASVNQMDDLRDLFPIADIYIGGHDHQRYARPVTVLIPTSDNKGVTFIKQKRQYLSRAGSFKKAYTEDVSSYEVGRLLRPADLGPLKFEIGFHRDISHGDRIITDIEAVV